jgi:hypothetical protein
MPHNKQLFSFMGIAILFVVVGCGGNHQPSPDGGTSGSDGGPTQNTDGGTVNDAGAAAQLLDPCDPLSVNSRCVGQTEADCSLVQGAYRLTASMMTCMTSAPCYEGADATGKVTAQCGCTLGTNQGCVGNLSHCYRYTDPTSHETLQTCSCIAGQPYCCLAGQPSCMEPVGDPPVDANHVYVFACNGTDGNGNPYPYPQADLLLCHSNVASSYAEYCSGANGCLACSPSQYVDYNSSAQQVEYYCDANGSPTISSCPTTVCIGQ